jgi:hypothetical protein
MGMPEMILLLVFFTIGAVVVFSLNNRYRVRELVHKETLAALEKGQPIPIPQAQPWSPRVYLLRGMIWLFAGLAAAVAISALAAIPPRPITAWEKFDQVTRARERGATPEEIQLIMNETSRDQRPPVAIGLLGLIPASVGLAYLIFYRVESKKLLS